MVTLGENTFSHHGSNTEDNATKDLRWLLANAPWSATSTVLKPVFDAVSNPDEFNIDSTTNIQTQVRTGEAATGSETTVLVGLAPEGTDHEDTTVDDFSPEKDAETSRKLDLAIQLGPNQTIGIEAKLGGFNDAQLRDHARELNADSFGVMTWNDLYESLSAAQEQLDKITNESRSLSGSPLAIPTTERLFEEYRDFLQDGLVTLTETLGKSRWSAGENVIETVELLGENELKHKTVPSDTEPLPVSAGLRFQTRPDGGNNGPSLYFSPEEWKQLVDDLDQEFINHGFAEGSTELMNTRYKATDDDYIPLAKVSGPSGNTKYMRYGVPSSRDSNNPTVYLNKSTADGGNLSGQIPMYGSTEINAMFGSDSPLTRLFTAPETVFESME